MAWGTFIPEELHARKPKVGALSFQHSSHNQALQLMGYKVKKEKKGGKNG